jgi:hypothetical protein
MKNRVAPAILALMLAACGGSETSTPTPESVSEAVSEAKKEVEKAKGNAGKAEIDPCTVLDEKLVRSHLDVGDAVVSFRLSSSTRHPLCAASWPKPDAEQIKRDMQAKMTEYMTAAARGEKVDMPSFKLENEASLTLNSPSFESAENAASAFDSAMRVLEQGVRDKNNPDAPPQFQYDTHSVAGVGDRASWTPGLSQISVQSGRHLFHVRVSVGDPQVNQEAAKAMAREIAAKLPR